VLLPKYSESHALVIGINDYKVAPCLGYAVNDANAVAEVLHNSFKFPESNIHLCLNSAATRAAGTATLIFSDARSQPAGGGFIGPPDSSVR
jgi:hypothetical protein